MNNIVEYEALVLGLQKAINLNVVAHKVVGYSQIVVWKVHNTIHFLSPHLKSYQQEVWKLFSNFRAFNITFEPRMRNVATNAFANTTSRISPLRDRFTIEILYRPSISNNITNLHIFDDDQQLLHFMVNDDTFKDAAIDEDEHEQSLQAGVDIKKGHLIPKGVVSLEKLYDLQELL